MHEDPTTTNRTLQSHTASYWRLEGNYRAIGDTTHGTWGSVIRGRVALEDPHFPKEMLMEVLRQRYAPNAISRLDALFAFLTEADARAWYQTNSPQRPWLFELEPAPNASAELRNLTAFDRDWTKARTDLDVATWAQNYWTVPPQPGDVTEVLIGGSATVRRAVDLRL